MTILVTGGAGFIGSHVVESLLKLCHKVVCIDNFDTFYCRSVKEKNIEKALENKNYSITEVDITDFKAVINCFENNKFDLVIHLAAKAGVRPSIENPKEYCSVNIGGTLNILEAMKKHQVKKMIFASSSSVYGNNPKVPFAETDFVDNPVSPYAASKKAGELLCHTYSHLHAFDIFCLRFFTVYGPRQRPDLAIHKFTDCICKGEAIPVFGDGNTSRDYTYIEDIVDGIIKAVDRLKGCEIINLGESQTISLNKMIQTIEKGLNKTAVKNHLPMQAGDVHTTYADISKARKILNYNPVWDFDKGIAGFLKWKKL